ncbi:DUF4157 domain-containing protein [Janthinobacterium sp. PAMC25594]|nr:DUF4157 domain-containing protein [Janthinobacterium sp. PAMC25594]
MQAQVAQSAVQLADGGIDPRQLGLLRGGGQPLSQALLAKMESAFNADFSDVRVHIGPQAGRLGALAFTTGKDLYFATWQDAATALIVRSKDLAPTPQIAVASVRWLVNFPSLRRSANCSCRSLPGLG